MVFAFTAVKTSEWSLPKNALVTVEVHEREQGFLTFFLQLLSL